MTPYGEAIARNRCAEQIEAEVEKHKIEKLEAENARLRQALEIIAKRDCWYASETARHALGRSTR